MINNINLTGNNQYKLIYSQPKDDSRFKLSLYNNDGDEVEKEYDVRNLLLLFEVLLKNSDLYNLLDMDHEELKKLIDREEKLSDLIDE